MELQNPIAQATKAAAKRKSQKRKAKEPIPGSTSVKKFSKIPLPLTESLDFLRLEPLYFVVNLLRI